MLRPDLIVLDPCGHGRNHRCILPCDSCSDSWGLGSTATPDCFIRVRHTCDTASLVTSVTDVILGSGFMHLGAGLSVGLTGLAAGYAIGVVGDAVRTLSTTHSTHFTEGIRGQC